MNAYLKTVRHSEGPIYVSCPGCDFEAWGHLETVALSVRRHMLLEHGIHSLASEVTILGPSSAFVDEDEPWAGDEAS